MENQYTEEQIRAFDAKLQPYMTPSKHTPHTRVLTLETQIAIMERAGTVVRTGERTFEIIKDKMGKYLDLDQKFREWLMWRGKKQYAKRKEMEALERMAQAVVTEHTLSTEHTTETLDMRSEGE